MAKYAVKEIYCTIQGEGYHTGQVAVFCRFSGCNLWSGVESDRHKAECQFCDTDFWGTDGLNGGKYSAEELVLKCLDLWPEGVPNPYLVCTGGEPLLQLDNNLIREFKQNNFHIAIESNGTLPMQEGIDWICVSPKANTKLKVEKGDELKLVYPQNGLSPKDFEHLDFNHFSLQPLDSTDKDENTKACIDYCLKHPNWKLSIQMHKMVGLP